MKHLKYFKLFESSINANGQLVDLDTNLFDEFPEDVLKTLENNFFYMYSKNFNWNEKTRELGGDFNKWWDKRKQSEFLKNLDKIISAVRYDLILNKRKKLAKRKLEAFEELIKPVFGNNITGDALTKFEEEVILNPYCTILDIEKAFQEAKNIIDEYGNIDQMKIQKSTFFPGGEINIPNFERFVEKNPQYQKTFDIWNKLNDEEIKLMLAHTKAHHIIGYKELRRLYDFLIEFRKRHY